MINLFLLSQQIRFGKHFLDDVLGIMVVADNSANTSHQGQDVRFNDLSPVVHQAALPKRTNLSANNLQVVAVGHLISINHDIFQKCPKQPCFQVINGLETGGKRISPVVWAYFKAQSWALANWQGIFTAISAQIGRKASWLELTAKTGSSIRSIVSAFDRFYAKLIDAKCVD